MSTPSRCTEKVSHTPGPWEFVEEDNIFLVNTPAGRRIAEFQPRSTHVSVKERNANGRLIAAAPELLEALKGLLWLATPHFSDQTQMDHIARCEAVIKKACGE